MKLKVSLWLLSGFILGFLFARIGFSYLLPSMIGSKLVDIETKETQHYVNLFLKRIIDENVGFQEASELERISIIRQWVYVNTDIAATNEFLIDSKIFPVEQLSPEESLFLHRRNLGGAWCTDIAHILMQIYELFGYRTWRYDYGIKDGLTHSVTLVEINNKVYLQDAYFNQEYCSESGDPLPFFQVLKSLKSRRSVKYKSGPRRYRDVHYRHYKIPDVSWVSDTQGGPVKLTDSHYVHKGNSSIENFLSKWKKEPLMDYTIQFLKGYDYPADMTYLLLFPFGIYDKRFRTDSADSEMYAKILELIAKEP